MPINPNIPLQAANIPQIRYQPESQFESFAKIQPTLNAMQQMRTQALESQEKMAQRQALQKMRQDLMAAGKSGDLGMYAQALIGSGDARLMELGAKINQGLMEEQAAEQSLAPFRGQPVTRESVQNMLRAGGAAARAGEQLRQTLPTTPAEVETARAFGFQQTPEGYSAMKGAGRAEAQGPEIVQLMRARDALPAGSPDRALVQARIDRLNAPPAPLATVQMPAQEKAFESTLGSEQAKKLMADKAVAEDAVSIIDTVNTGRQLLKSGMITGFGAEFATNFGSALNQLGINFAEDLVANTQAFSANMAANVGRIIKQFGAGTGLSNADREYAEKMAGGKITLDQKALERILDINERAARNVIKYHNRRAQGVKSNIPLTVEMPAEQQQSQAPMYARNPKTGERIMSVDGGSTWTPAR